MVNYNPIKYTILTIFKYRFYSSVKHVCIVGQPSLKLFHLAELKVFPY